MDTIEDMDLDNDDGILVLELQGDFVDTFSKYIAKEETTTVVLKIPVEVVAGFIQQARSLGIQ